MPAVDGVCCWSVACSSNVNEVLAHAKSQLQIKDVFCSTLLEYGRFVSCVVLVFIDCRLFLFGHCGCTHRSMMAVDTRLAGIL